MKKQTFAVGDRVGLAMHVEGSTEYDDGELVEGLRWDEYEDPCFGTVSGITQKGKIQVEWDDDAEGPALDYLYGDTVEPHQLLPEADVKEQLSLLEQEFKEVSKKISKKCKEAAEILLEANELALQTGRSLYDMNDYGGLYRAMDECGWRTSSFGC
jgi:hypothetical protein